ncbi:MAG: hypothetical protein OHK0029_34950 [Armatimonadaceae bacterium]
MQQENQAGSNERWDEIWAHLRDPNADPVPFLLTLLTDPASEMRASGARLLREVPSPRAVPALLPLVRDTDDWVRGEAVETLGFLADTQALRAILDAADDSDELVRVNVAEALGSLGICTPEVTQTLCRLLNDPYFPVRIFAAESLGDLGDPEAKPALEQAQTDIPAVRVWVYYGLARLGDPFALTPTLNILRRGGAWARNQAARVLQRIAPPGASERIASALAVALQRNNPPLVRSFLREYHDALLAQTGATRRETGPR